LAPTTPVRPGASAISPALVPLALFLPHKPTSKPLPAPSHLNTTTLGAPVGAPTGESLEPPMYASCLKTIELLAQAQVLISCKKQKRGIRHPTYADRTNGGRQPLVQTFLGGGPGSLRLDKDTVATMAGASRTYWTSGQGVGPMSSPHVHIEGSSSLSWSRITSTTESCSDGSVSSLPSARWCFCQ
jgi:hypothetical protein